MKNLLGIKVGMTQVFNEDGSITPVTIVQAGPCYVTQLKTADADGYSAVQVGFGPAKEKRLSNGEKGHLGLAKSGKGGKKSDANLPALAHLR